MEVFQRFFDILSNLTSKQNGQTLNLCPDTQYTLVIPWIFLIFFLAFQDKRQWSWSNDTKRGTTITYWQGVTINYVDKQGVGDIAQMSTILHKLTYIVNLSTFNKGGLESKSSKFCQRSLWMPPRRTYGCIIPFFNLKISRSMLTAHWTITKGIFVSSMT